MNIKEAINQCKQSLVDSSVSRNKPAVEVYIAEYVNAIRNNSLLPQKFINIGKMDLVINNSVCDELQNYATELLTKQGFTGFIIPHTGGAFNSCIISVEPK